MMECGRKLAAQPVIMESSLPVFPATFLLAAFALCASFACAQDNYEIQVYGAETVAPRSTMVEIHSNFTVEGSKTVIDGMLPTNHAEHETLEMTQGINDWAEVGFYVFTSIQPDSGWQWVGDHIRPRVRAPESWHWPVGVSISNEIGYQRAAFSPDTWTWEIRPIIDKTIGPWYFSFNPTLDRSFHGPSVNQGVVFSPNVKFSYNFTKKIAGGLEYYGSVRTGHGLLSAQRPAAAILSRDRCRLRPAMGIQLWRRRGARRDRQIT